MLRLPEPDRHESATASLGRVRDAVERVGERRGDGHRENRIDIRIGAQSGDHRGEDLRGEHRGGVHRIHRRGTARQQKA